MTMTNQAYDTLKEMIMKGEKEPDELLSIYQLSEELHMSRTPVTNAIKQLERDGLVRPLKNRGVVVQSISSRTVFDWFDLFLAYELLTLRLARNHDFFTFDLQALHSIIEKQEEAMEREDYYTYTLCNMDFIETFVATIGNEPMLQSVRSGAVKVVSFAVQKDRTNRSPRLHTGYKKNKQVVEALEKEDWETVEATLLHFREVNLERFIRFML